MTVIIEMAGIPGAGKTSLHIGLLNEMSNVGLIASECNPGLRVQRGGPVAKATRWIPHITTMVRYRGALAIALRAIQAGSRPFPERLQALRLLTVTLDRYRSIRRSRAPGIVLLDEGVVQRCFLIFVEADGVYADSLEEFLTQCPSPDGVLFLDVEPEEALRRTQDRKIGLPPRLANLDSSEAVKRLEEGAILLGRASEHLARNRHTDICRVGSDMPINVHEVACRIRDLSDESG